MRVPLLAPWSPALASTRVVATAKTTASATPRTAAPPTVSASLSPGVMTTPSPAMKIPTAAQEPARAAGASPTAMPLRASEATKMDASAPSTTNAAPTTAPQKPAPPPASPTTPQRYILMGATALATLSATLPTVTVRSTSACPLATPPTLKAPTLTTATAQAT